jgi:cupin superfamily acireductone dioxygenase involved in methionine salvage
MDDPEFFSKRITILRHDYKITKTDVLRIDRQNSHRFDEMYEPTCRDSETILLVTGGEIYYDVLIDNNNECDEEQWIRIFCTRGTLIVIPAGRNFRCTTTGQV